MPRKNSQELQRAVVKEDDIEPIVIPDGGFGWVICLVAFMVQFIVLGIMNNFGVLYTKLLENFGGSKSETAWVGSLTYGLMFASGPLATSLCERLGCRPVAVIGSLVAALGTFLASFSTDIYKMYLTYGVLFGIGASMCYFPSVIILPQYFSRHLSLANGLVSCGSGVGTMAMGPVVQQLVHHLGLQNTIRAITGLLLIVTVISMSYRNNIPVSYPDDDDPNGGRPLFDLSIFQNKAYIIFVIALCVYMLSYFVPFVHLAQMAIEYGVPEEQAALLVGFMSVSSTFGRLFFGKISDHPKVNRLYTYQLSLLCMGIANTLCPLFNTYFGLIVYCIVFGFFEGCYVCQCSVVTGDIVGRERIGPGVGILFGLKSIPLTLGPPFAGALYEISNSYQVAFYVSGFVPPLAACLMFAIPYFMPPPEDKFWRNCTVRGHSTNDSADGQQKLLPTSSSSNSDSSIGKTSKPKQDKLKLALPKLEISPSVSSMHRFFDLPKRVSMREIGSVSSIAIIPEVRSELRQRDSEAQPRCAV